MKGENKMDIQIRNKIESIIIGSALYNEECFNILAKAGFQENDFVFRTYRDVFSTMMKPFEEKSIRLSINTVREEYLSLLNSSNIDSESIKANKLKFESLSNSVEKNIEIYKAYISELTEETTKNKLIKVLKDAIALAEDKGSREAIEKITELYISSIETNEPIKGTTFNELLSENIDRYNPENKKDLDIEDIPTPEIKFLDEAIFDTCIKPGNICIISGKQSSGKSDFSKCLSTNDRKLYHYDLEKIITKK